MNSIYTLPPTGVETRWASPENPRGLRGMGGATNGGRKGRPNVPVAAGASIVLAEEGPGVEGTIRRIWLTIDERTPLQLRGLRLDFYWDGAATPAVSAPLGDFFGVGLGRTAKFDSEFFSSPEGRSFNACVPMPFRDGMRLVLTNETDRAIAMLFYDIDYTVGDAHGPDALYLHAHFRRENPTRLQQDYEFLPPVAGAGRFLGVHFGVLANRAAYGRTWWGEGEVKFFLDGDTSLPTLCGTGTEDYIGTAWGQGAYAHRYQGCPIADDATSQYCFYRYHVPDPLVFRKGIRATIQQIGYAGAAEQNAFAAAGNVFITGPNRTPVRVPGENTGGILFERQDDWSSCAYFYLDHPENNLPTLPPLAERIAGIV